MSFSRTRELDVRRVDFGSFVRPAQETGIGRPRVEPCLGYVIRHPAGVLLVDTGMGTDPEVDAHYHPQRVPLGQALSVVGTEVSDITGIVNCHLHFDHCGGNPFLGGRPVFTQRVELETARSTVDYTLPELVDAQGLHYELLDGETEIFPSITILPTPGHTTGHQSVVVALRDGTVVVAGQSHDTASDYAADVLARRAAASRAADGLIDDASGRDAAVSAALAHVPAWMERLERFDPARVVFAHDHSVWMP